MIAYVKIKGECFENFKELKALVGTQSENNIKAFQSDKGEKFFSMHLINF